MVKDNTKNLIKLFTSFNDVMYVDKTHTYYLKKDKTPLTSVTTFIGQYKNKFDVEYHSKRISERDNIPQEEIIKKWDDIRELACYIGENFHLFAEQVSLNKIYDKFEVSEKLMKMCIDFYKNFYAKGNTIIKTEILVYDIDTMLSGQSDFLFYNKNSDEFFVGDYKTNKKLDTHSEWENKMLTPVEHLDDCELEHYALQLSLYKYIIEKVTGIIFSDKLFIIWFNEVNDKAITYVLNYKKKEIEAMIKDRINKIKENGTFS